MKKRAQKPHAELIAWANGQRPDSPKTPAAKKPVKPAQCHHARLQCMACGDTFTQDGVQ